MDEIIIVEENEKYCFKNIKQAIEQFVDKKFYSLSKEEKYNMLRKKTMMNAILKQAEVIDIEKGDKVENIKENQYIILNEETFLLSLAKNNDIFIYEKEDADILVKQIDKSKLERINKCYIRVNDCANILLEKIIEKV